RTFAVDLSDDGKAGAADNRKVHAKLAAWPTNPLPAQDNNVGATSFMPTERAVGSIFYGGPLPADGDEHGQETVAFDFRGFRAAITTYNAAYDGNTDGNVDTFDFLRFRQRFNSEI